MLIRIENDPNSSIEEEENLQKIVHGLDQMFIAEEVPIGDEVECDNEGLNADEDVKWVELVEIPEELPEKPKVERKRRDYFSALWKIN